MFHKIRGKSVSDLKVKTTRNKPIHVEGDLVQVMEYMVKLHTDIYLMADMFFFYSIHFFHTISRNICSTAVNHIANIKVDTIFNAFKEIYIYYMKHGLHITTIHADREFTPLQSIIYKHIPVVPRINITSAN